MWVWHSFVRFCLFVEDIYTVKAICYANTYLWQWASFYYTEEEAKNVCSSIIYRHLLFIHNFDSVTSLHYCGHVPCASVACVCVCEHRVSLVWMRCKVRLDYRSFAQTFAATTTTTIYVAWGSYTSSGVSYNKCVGKRKEKKKDP